MQPEPVADHQCIITKAAQTALIGLGFFSANQQHPAAQRHQYTCGRFRHTFDREAVDIGVDAGIPGISVDAVAAPRIERDIPAAIGRHAEGRTAMLCSR
jgi:hypothetical protein